MRGVLERCEEIAQSKRHALEPETSGTTGSTSNPGKGFGPGRAPAWHEGAQVNPTNTPSAGTKHGGHIPTGPMQAPNNGNPAGRDHQGRPMREVWVGGVPHLVVD